MKEYLHYSPKIKRISIVLIFSIFSISDIYSQGFNWQRGARMPYIVPDFFIGINAGASITNNLGSFNLQEDLIECCNFSDGTGKAYFFGITSEYWYEGITAFNLSLNYYKNIDNFSISKSLATRTGNFVTQYGMNSKTDYLGIEISAKRRINDMHLFYGVGVSGSILINDVAEYTEQAISDNVPFEKRVIYNGKIKELNRINVLPFIYAGYDADLGIGYYASPFLGISYNINSIIETESWHRLSLRFGIKIFRTL